jgi:hypothetical protein
VLSISLDVLNCQTKITTLFQYVISLVRVVLDINVRTSYILVPFSLPSRLGDRANMPLERARMLRTGSRDFLVSDIGAKEKPRRAIYGACRGIWTRRARE